MMEAFVPQNKTPPQSSMEFHGFSTCLLLLIPYHPYEGVTTVDRRSEKSCGFPRSISWHGLDLDLKQSPIPSLVLLPGGSKSWDSSRSLGEGTHAFWASSNCRSSRVEWAVIASLPGFVVPRALRHSPWLMQCQGTLGCC